MAEITGVISKPVFDTEAFKVGKAIRVKRINQRGYTEQQFDAIVTETNDLKLEVSRYDQREYEMRDETITIDSVRLGLIEIQFLDVVKEETE